MANRRVSAKQRLKIIEQAYQRVQAARNSTEGLTLDALIELEDIVERALYAKLSPEDRDD